MTLRRVYHTFYVVQGENSAKSCARGDNLRSVVLFTKLSFPALSFLLMNDKTVQLYSRGVYVGNSLGPGSLVRKNGKIGEHLSIVRIISLSLTINPLMYNFKFKF